MKEKRRVNLYILVLLVVFENVNSASMASSCPNMDFHSSTHVHSILITKQHILRSMHAKICRNKYQHKYKDFIYIILHLVLFYLDNTVVPRRSIVIQFMQGNILWHRIMIFTSLVIFFRFLQWGISTFFSTTVC